jgi:hypothetical protein
MTFSRAVSPNKLKIRQFRKKSDFAALRQAYLRPWTQAISDVAERYAFRS